MVKKNKNSQRSLAKVTIRLFLCAVLLISIFSNVVSEDKIKAEEPSKITENNKEKNEDKEKTEEKLVEKKNCDCKEQCSQDNVSGNCEVCNKENASLSMCEGKNIETKSIEKRSNVLAMNPSELELNISDGSIIIEANGVTQNGTLIPNSQGKTYIITGTGKDNDKLEINVSATVLLKNVSMQTKQIPNQNYNKDLNPISVNAKGVTILLEGENTLTTDHYYNAAINVKANGELSIDSASKTGSLDGTLNAITTKSNDENHNAGAHERFPSVAIGDNGGTSDNKGTPYQNNIASARNAFDLNIKGGTFNIQGYPTVFGNRQKTDTDSSQVLANVNITGGYVLGGGTMVDPYNSSYLIVGKKVNASFGNKPLYKGTVFAEQMNTMSNIDLSGSLVLGDNSGPVTLTNVNIIDDSSNRSYGIEIGSNSPVIFNQCDLKIKDVFSKSSVTFKNSKVDTIGYIRVLNYELATPTSVPLELLIEDSTILINPKTGIFGIGSEGITSNYAGGNITFRNSDVNIAITTSGDPDMGRYAVICNGNVLVENTNLETTIESLDYKATRVSIYAKLDGNGFGGNIDILGSNVNGKINNIASDGNGSAYSMYASNKAKLEDTKFEGDGLYFGKNELMYKNSYVINSSDSAMSYSKKNLIVDNSYVYTPKGYLAGTETLEIKNNSYVDTRYLKDATTSSIENSVVMNRMQVNKGTNVVEPLNEGYTYGKVVLKFDPVKLASIEIPKDMTLFVEKSKAGELYLSEKQVILINGILKNQNSIVVSDQAKLVTNNLVQNEGTITIAPDATLELQEKGVIKNFQTGKITKEGTLINNGQILNSVLFNVKKNNSSWTNFENRWIGIDNGVDTLKYEEEIDYNGVSIGDVIYAPQGDYTIYHSKKFTPAPAADDTVLTSNKLSSELSSLQVEADFYDITFEKNDNSRSAIETRMLLNGSKYSDFPTVKRDGYTFEGWNTEADGKGTTIDGKSPLKLTKETTLYAQWKVIKHTIKFETDGGSTVDEQNVDNGKTVTKPTEPTKAGYVFSGWYTDANHTTSYDFKTLVKEDITLYAKWETIKHTIKFDTDGGSAVDEQNVDNGKTVTKPTEPTKEGYNFSGWYTDANHTSSYDFKTLVKEDITLYVKWETIKHTIKFETDGGSTVDEQNVDYGKTVTQPIEPTKAGYVFSGWYTDANHTTSYDFKTSVKENITLYAKWETIKHTVKFETDGGSTVDEQYVDYGKTVTKPTEPTKAGYVFGGWYTDANHTTSYDFKTLVKENITLYAKWETIKHTVKFETDGGSTVDEQNVDYGKTVTKPTEPTKAGYVFSGWYTDANHTTSYDFKTLVKEDITLYAKWEKINEIKPISPVEDNKGTKNPSLPNTSDTTKVGILFILLLASLLVGIVIKKKRIK